MIINGDSMEVLKTLDENSVDSIVTDPPYGLSFMGKAWDHSVPSAELWQEALRVLKPGGYLLAFAGTRTQHRMAVNIEDAGFEIRDMIAWVYGSGFPKSHNIGKAVDKIQGNEREVTGEREVPDIRGDAYGTMNDKQGGSYNSLKIQDTKGSSPYEGWGTALKPSLEPITVARKPLSEKTVAQNVLEWGTGGINIDGSRVEIPEGDDSGWSGSHAVPPSGSATDAFGVHKFKEVCRDKPTGRFPANLIHDGSDEVVGLFPDTGKGNGKPYSYAGTEYGNKETSMFNGDKPQAPSNRNDSGSAARFFYCAKAGKAERNKGLEGFEEQEIRGGGGRVEQGYDLTDESQVDLKEADRKYGAVKAKKANTHPTVKPVKLMQYLVKLVTPVGGIVLDPFNGSGTTGIACKLEDFEYIGIELDPEYCTLSEARIKGWGEQQTKLI